MVRLTQSLAVWLMENYPKELPLIIFGHVELFTDEMWTAYIEWCKTDEGMQYLKGSSKYREDWDGNE